MAKWCAWWWRGALRVGVMAGAACAPAAQNNVVPPQAGPSDAGADVAAASPSLTMSAAIALPTGAMLTADAAPGSRLLELDPRLQGHPDFRAGFAVATALSPDGATLAVLTSGYNQLENDKLEPLPGARDEHVFLYAVTPGGLREAQVVAVPNTFVGLAFSPAGDRLYVSGGSDDVVRELAKDASGAWSEVAPAVALGHLLPDGKGGLGLGEGPYAAGIGVSQGGARVVVANHENDSVSIVDAASRKVLGEVSLRPGGGRAGGEFPMGVVVVGEDRAYVTAQRDREVVEVDLNGAKVLRRFRVGGLPTRVIASKDGAWLYVANANSDSVSVIDRVAGTTREEINVAGPLGALPLSYRGASPNALRLSPDEKTLYVSLGGSNAIAIVALAGPGRGVSEVTGLVPTGFYPNDVSVSADGRALMVAYGKSSTGPNTKGPRHSRDKDMVAPFDTFGDGTGFALQLVRGGVHTFPVPDARVLPLLTAQALENNHASKPPSVPKIFEALSGKVKHVVLVIGENRTYDQMLGDVPAGDGDKSLTLWGADYTPNLHALVSRYALFDRFFDAGGVSGDGWQWTMAGRTTDAAEKEVPIEYAVRGKHTYDWEGTTRAVNVSLATLTERLAFNPKTPKDPDLLPGQADFGGIDGPAQGGHGYLWDAALAAGKTLRNYGCFVDDYRYSLPEKDGARIAPNAHPFATKTRVAFPTSPALHDVTDPYFYGFDMKVADYWRVQEWLRERVEQEKSGAVPALELVRLPHDHTGNFKDAKDGVDTPDAQVADHDYALGLLVERLSQSKEWESTVIVALEDDAQNGADHVDAHRSFVAFAGGHVKKGAVVHTRYSTPSVLRTIELLLGLSPMAIGDAVAPPIEEAFTEDVDKEPFAAIVPSVLRATKLPLPKETGDKKAAMLPRGDAAYWALATLGMDFDHADRLPAGAYNRALICGLTRAEGCASTMVEEVADEE